jgi:hypothetical protein
MFNVRCRQIDVAIYATAASHVSESCRSYLLCWHKHAQALVARLSFNFSLSEVQLAQQIVCYIREDVLNY